MKVKVPGYTTLEGTPKAILTLMKDSRFFQDIETLAEYVENLQQTFWRAYHVELNVTGDTVNERAESLLREMARYGFIEIEEETA